MERGRKTEGIKKQYHNYWGKFSNKESGSNKHHLLVHHSLDVAAVAWHLLNPELQFCRYVSSYTGLSSKLVRYLVVFSLMLHDIGKFSKTFQALVADLFQRLFPGEKIRAYTERHDTLGFVLWQGDSFHDTRSVSFVVRNFNSELCGLLDYFIKASFGHHGIPPKESAQGGSRPFRVSAFFDSEDVAAAQSFCLDCLSILGDPPDLPEKAKPFKKSLKDISWTIAGLAVLSDWIGSDRDSFVYPVESTDLSDYWRNIALVKAQDAVAAIDWTPNKARPFFDNDSLIRLFPFIKEPTPLQSLAVTLPLQAGPQLFIVEDVTGAGKTEAAIAFAARIMNAQEADGLYIGLPTMATANSMYERMHKAYLNLYEDGERPSLILSHGARHLSDTFSETVVINQQKKDRSYGKEETASAMCNAWYADNRKKALLADVGIGTIDQALMAILPARHQSLRLLGLQRKILIIDEVHAYDAYVGQILETLLEAHAQSGGSAILLSATLPHRTKERLQKAFCRQLMSSGKEIQLEKSDRFPLITQVSSSGAKAYSMDTRKEVKRKVSISFSSSYSELLDRVEACSSKGACLCWIRNTVKDARKTFYDLQKRGAISGEQLHLFHSRFAMTDRNRIEESVLNHFDRNSDAALRRGRVVVATQVLEQSLDLDFDEMITDIAPVDLLIQRAGRLHRHTRDRFGNRCEGVGERREPVLTIFSPDFDEAADENWLARDFAGTLAVYRDPGVLWRTQKLLLEKKAWSMPDDARLLIETVYGEDNELEAPEGLINTILRAVGEGQSKKAMADLNALVLEKGYCRDAVKADQWNEEERIPTRLSEENVEIVLAVMKDEKIIPYAEDGRYGWDLSSLSVSLREWNKIDYHIPEEHEIHIEKLKTDNPRLKFAEIVLVSQQSEAALASNQPVSEFYSPYLGWGSDLEKEE